MTNETSNHFGINSEIIKSLLQAAIMRAKNFYDKQPNEVSLEGIFGQIKVVEGPNTTPLARTTELCRMYKQCEKDENLSLRERDEAAKNYAKSKKNLPLIFPHVIFDGEGKQLGNVKGFRFLVDDCILLGGDLDHVSPQDMQDFHQKISASPHLVLEHNSPSCEGKRIFCLVRGVKEALQKYDDTPSPAKLNHLYKHLYDKFIAHIKETTGYELDTKCKDISRGFSITYDPEAFINPNPIPLIIDMNDYSPLKPGRPKKNISTGAPQQAALGQVADIILRTLKMKGLTTDPGGRNDYLHHFASYANQYGVAQDEVLNWALTNMEESDFGEAEIQAAIASAYKRTDEFGIKKVNVSNIEKAEQILCEMGDFRYNTIKEQVDIRFHDPELGPQDWSSITDRDADTLYIETRKRCKVAKDEFYSMINSRKFSINFNPMEDYLASCSSRQPGDKDHLLDLFNHLLLVDETLRDKLYPYFMMWSVRALAMALERIDNNQLILALIGDENTGKSFFCKQLLPPELRNYYQRVDPTDKIDKDFIIMTSKKLIVNLDERVITRKESASIKSVVTGGVKDVRAAYARNHKGVRPRGSFTLTCNHKQYIGENEGNRRYLTMHVKGTLNFNEHPIDYKGLYGQLFYYLNNGELRQQLTQQEVAELKEINQDFTEANPCEDAILTYFARPEPGMAGAHYVTATQIKQAIGYGFSNEEMSLANIVKAMEKLGFPQKPRSKNSHKAKLFYVVRIDQSRLAS